MGAEGLGAIAVPARSSPRRSHTRGRARPWSRRQSSVRQCVGAGLGRAQRGGRRCLRGEPSSQRLRIAASNSAMPPMMVTSGTSVVVSNQFPRETKPQPRSARSCRMLCRSRLERARRSSLVTLTTSPGGQGSHELAELAPAIGQFAGCLLAEYPLAASGFQRVHLRGAVLGVRDDPGIAISHRLAPIESETFGF